MGEYIYNVQARCTGDVSNLIINQINLINQNYLKNYNLFLSNLAVIVTNVLVVNGNINIVNIVFTLILLSRI